MNVFEDLIVELKEENLLENTVIEAETQEKTDIQPPKANEKAGDNQKLSELAAPGDVQTKIVSEPRTQLGETSGFEIEVVETVSEPVDSPATKPSTPKKVKHGKEFFKKRAVDEVSSLQMVEHILTGVEREYMKVVPKAYDDFNAKKALHVFLNIAESANSEEHKEAEFALMKETEAWGLALLERDRDVAVSHIRQYCENSRPALSSQAILSLARFYRNAPYSESVRAKFDFVITRLFTRPVEFDKRVCLFERDEMLNHLNTLYSDWSSIPLYAADDDESNVLLTGLSFDELAIEAENASSFDQLIESDFFGRLRLFKDSISELFYAPTVTVSAIESNVRIGNAYVNLIVKERQKLDAASIQSKYEDFNGQSVSDAAGRSLNLPELLNGLTDEALKAKELADEETESDTVKETLDFDEAKPASKTVKARSPLAQTLIDGVLGINRWILIVGAVMIVASGGLYIWSSYIVDETVSTAGVTAVDLEVSGLSEHIKIGKISGDRFYGVLLPSWDALPKEKRQEYLQKVLQIGAEKGYKQVDLITKDGKSAGFASSTRLEVYMP